MRKLPELQWYKPRSCFKLVLSGKAFYLGRHRGEAEARRMELLIEWLKRDRSWATDDPITFGDLLDELQSALERRGSRDHKKMKSLLGGMPKALRSQGACTVSVKQIRDWVASQAWSRSTMNTVVGLIRRSYRHAIDEGLLQPQHAAGFATMSGFRAGDAGHETDKIKPADPDAVHTVITHAPAIIGAIIQLQALTGCRPGEALAFSWSDVDQTVTPWVWSPAHHKTKHRGKSRSIFIGPKARTLLTKWEDSEQPFISISDHIYRSTIIRICHQYGVQRWAPNQLRHTAGTLARKRGGIETAAALLGHSQVETTQVYAEQSDSRAASYAEEWG